MKPVYRPKLAYQSSKKDNYAIPKLNYKTLYLEEYEIFATVETDEENIPHLEKNLETIIENLLKDTNPNTKRKDPKIINLEDRIKNIIPKKERENPEEIYYPNEDPKEKDYSIGSTDRKSGAKVIYVDQSSLPLNVLGLYKPSNHTIYINKDLPAYQKEFVYHHEVAHALGIRNEVEADKYAASIVGYNLRSPQEAYRAQMAA